MMFTDDDTDEVSLVSGLPSNKPTDPPTTKLLWWLHITNLIIWCCQWSFLVNTYRIENNYDTYCANAYFSGYHSPQCSAEAMSFCDDNMKCAIFDEEDSYYTGGNWVSDADCKTDADCSRCKCVAAKRYNDIKIALFVFLAIGLVLQLYRLWITCHLSGNANTGELSIIADSCWLQWVQLMNAEMYKKEIIGNHYNKRTIFKYKGDETEEIECPCCDSLWHAVYFVFYHFPVFVCAVVLFFTSIDDNQLLYEIILIFTIVVSLVLYSVNIVLKQRFGNLPPYNMHVVPNFAAPTLQQPGNDRLAISDYQATGNGDMSIKRGDEVEIMGKQNENGWIMVKNKKGDTGFVPFDYLQIERNQSPEVEDVVPSVPDEEDLLCYDESEGNKNMHPEYM